METLDILRKAIAQHHPVRFRYVRPGKPRSVRRGNPHALFRDKRHRLFCDIVQTSGATEQSGQLPAWRQFDVRYIDAVELMEDASFRPDRRYNPQSDKYAEAVLLMRA